MKLFLSRLEREIEGVAIFFCLITTPGPLVGSPSVTIGSLSCHFPPLSIDDTSLLAGRIEYQLGRLSAAVGHLQVKP